MTPSKYIKSIRAATNKKVIVRAAIEYEIEVPNDWDKDKIEFHRNESSWCQSSMIEELTDLCNNKGCLCGHVRFEYLREGKI